MSCCVPSLKVMVEAAPRLLRESDPEACDELLLAGTVEPCPYSDTLVGGPGNSVDGRQVVVELGPSPGTVTVTMNVAGNDPMILDVYHNGVLVGTTGLVGSGSVDFLYTPDPEWIRLVITYPVGNPARDVAITVSCPV